MDGRSTVRVADLGVGYMDFSALMLLRQSRPLQAAQVT